MAVDGGSAGSPERSSFRDNPTNILAFVACWVRDMVFRAKRHFRARQLLTWKVMVFTDYAKRRILHFREKGCSFAEIVKRLHEENISASKAGVWSFLKKYNQSGEISRKKGSGAPTVINQDVKELIDRAMKRLLFSWKRCWRNMATEFHYQQYCVAGNHWGGLFGGVLIASLLGNIIRRRGWPGHTHISRNVRQVLGMWYIPMKHQCN